MGGPRSGDCGEFGELLPVHRAHTSPVLCLRSHYLTHYGMTQMYSHRHPLHTTLWGPQGPPRDGPVDHDEHERNQQIRAWANANGYEVSERGRLSSEVTWAYEQAQVAEAEAPAAAPRKRAPRKKVAVARK